MTEPTDRCSKCGHTAELHARYSTEVGGGWCNWKGPAKMECKCMWGNFTPPPQAELQTEDT